MFFFVTFVKNKKTTMYATRSCCVCDKDVSIMSLSVHIPKCYREWCLSVGMVPLCTCQICKGEKTHNGDTLEVKCSG